MSNCIDISMHRTVRAEAGEVIDLPSCRVQYITFIDKDGTELRVTLFLDSSFDGVKLASEVTQ